MKAFLLILLFVFASSKNSEDLMQLAECVIDSKKIKEYLPKLVEAIKTKDFNNILKVGFAAFKEIKTELTQCYYSEPVLKGNCKNVLPYRICCIQCPSIFGKSICLNNCLKKHC